MCSSITYKNISSLEVNRVSKYIGSQIYSELDLLLIEKLVFIEIPVSLVNWIISSDQIFLSLINESNSDKMNEFIDRINDKLN
jgi:hypothetical protein